MEVLIITISLIAHAVLCGIVAGVADNLKFGWMFFFGIPLGAMLSYMSLTYDEVHEIKRILKKKQEVSTPETQE